jgi:transcriptional regulator with XRE-family HTH domain
MSEKKIDIPALLALVLLRFRKGWDQAGLAKASRTSPSQISAYHRGLESVPREVLERAAEAAAFPAHLLDPLLRELGSFVAASQGRSRVDRVISRGAVAELVEVSAKSLDVILAPLNRKPARRPPSPADREEAEVLWELLRPLTSRERLMLVEESSDFRTWALCERVVAESIQRAANEPPEALALAQLAMRIADLATVDTRFRSRLRGYALAGVCNGYRVCQNLQAAREAFVHAEERWKEGTGGDRGLLSEALLPWIEAALRRAERKFRAALQKIDQALTLDHGELRGKILVTKSLILEALGDAYGSTRALAEAATLIDSERDPRTAWGVQFNLTMDLCLLERFEEAEPRLAGVRGLAERLGGELDRYRVVWLEGKVAAGLGRLVEAEEAFLRVREKAEEKKLGYTYALVSLDLSLVLLQQGRTGEVKALAGEMLAFFESQGIEREALAAVRLFCEAARREAATVELARRVGRFLHRAQLDPGLKFEDWQTAL